MNVLITGATGLLGRYLVIGKKPAQNILGLYIGSYEVPGAEGVQYIHSDIQHKNFLKEIFDKYTIDTVIHAGGVANVDFCETQYEIAYLSNVVGTQNIIDLCAAKNIKMVFVSSNAVFNGKKAPYKETDKPNPVNTYGKMKLECEKRVLSGIKEPLIIRPILMYGWNGEHERKNLVTYLLDKLPAGKAVNMVNDVYENPLYSGQCAEIIWKLIEGSRSGIYHIGGQDTVNRYEYAMAIADIFGLDKKLIYPVGSEFFPNIAPRPKNTSYDTSKTRRDTRTEPLGIKEGLSIMKSSPRGAG